MTSSHGPAGETARRGVRGWPIWQLPPRLLAPVLVVELTAVLLVLVGLLDHPVLDPDDAIALALLGGLGLVHTELARKVERVRWRLTGDLHVDLTSVWVFAAAVVLPAGYAAVFGGGGAHLPVAALGADQGSAAPAGVQHHHDRAVVPCHRGRHAAWSGPTCPCSTPPAARWPCSRSACWCSSP